ncbi:hypothetical protein ISS04_00020 [Candidatus Woesearchaeota archaeon]|nr:hypothetical protein [Candidatus Woesearchaeota archaeon]
MKNSVEIKLSKHFYGMKELEKTKKAFEGVCGCEIKEQKDYFDVYLVPKEKEENLELEFANYVLALMK